MAALIKTLDLNGNEILPRTVAKAVTTEDGSNVEAALKNVGTDSVKISEEVASATGVVAGSSLSSFLLSQINATANVLAAAEVVD